MGVANNNTGPESCVNDELSVQDISEDLCFDQWNAQLLKQLLPFPHQGEGLLACVNFIFWFFLNPAAPSFSAIRTKPAMEEASILRVIRSVKFTQIGRQRLSARQARKKEFGSSVLEQASGLGQLKRRIQQVVLGEVRDEHR